MCMHRRFALRNWPVRNSGGGCLLYNPPRPLKKNSALAAFVLVAVYNIIFYLGFANATAAKEASATVCIRFWLYLKKLIEWVSYGFS